MKPTNLAQIVNPNQDFNLEWYWQIKSQKTRDISGLKKYLGNTDLNIDLDALRGRNDPR